MKFLQEVTVWADPAIVNHLYVMTDSKDKMIAFKHASSAEFKVFKAPIRIDTRGRKFKEVANTFGFTVAEPEVEGRVHRVMGSRGEEYVVSELAGRYSCSCSGFKFRGKCKHAEMIQNKVVT